MGANFKNVLYKIKRECLVNTEECEVVQKFVDKAQYKVHIDYNKDNSYLWAQLEFFVATFLNNPRRIGKREKKRTAPKAP